MRRLAGHRARIAVTLLPVLLLLLLHVAGVWRLTLVERLDHLIYDARLRASMPRTLDPRIVIVDIDEASLQDWGQWPWSRDKLARLTTELTGRQRALVVGFDVVFAEPDPSSGLDTLQALARGALRETPGFAAALRQLEPRLDRDGAFAEALRGQPVALGYYFTRSDAPRASGRLPAPVWVADAAPQDGQALAIQWNGYGGSLDRLALAARSGGFINSAIDARDDGVVRATPLLAHYRPPAGSAAGAPDGYYESLALAIYRLATGVGTVQPVLAKAGRGQAPVLKALALQQPDGRTTHIQVDREATALVPFRGPSGAQGGSFRYVSARALMDGEVPEGTLQGKVVLVGATAPALQDLRATPVSAVYPGVEVHANVVSGLLDGRMLSVPDYAAGYEFLTLLLAGLVLAIGLSSLPAMPATLLALVTAAVLTGLNTWLHWQARLVLPLAATLLAVGGAFVLNMSWGYFVEQRDRRNLARLFGTYVPPQIVAEMLVRPQRYSMRAESKQLTVMFCDMRGFTALSERLAPLEVQALLNDLFSRLTDVINAHYGTVDKYMGDCVMAFWGAPVDLPDHAERAVHAAIDMAAAVREINERNLRCGLPGVSVGIGLNTGLMSVGDMGSSVRRSYTVVGDAVNLAARLEGLSGRYGVEIVASQATRQQAPSFVWQELDRVSVRGRARIDTIYTPVGRSSEGSDALPDATLQAELDAWHAVLLAYRAQDCVSAQALLAPLLTQSGQKYLYLLYSQRLASMALQPKVPEWDGATHFDTKP